MLTVETDPAAVEERLRSGRLACPGCAGVLAGWGRARARTVRDPDGGLRIVPRRSRCTGCRATHVLLPVLLLVRRADTAAVIGAALDGEGGRGRAPAGSPSCWAGRRRRCAAGCGASPLASRRSGWCSPGGAGRLAPDPVLPGPAGSGVGGRGRRGERRGRGVHGQVLHRRGAGLAGRLRGLGGRGCCRRAGPPRPAGVDQHELPLTPGGSSSVIIAACPDTDEHGEHDEEVAHPMAVRDDEAAARTERARAIGLFRYELIREAADPGLSTRARGRLVRADRRARAHRPGRAPGAGLPRHPGPVDPGVAPRRVRRAGARPAPVRARGCRSR